jgi:Asp-tRNA(Asn)/Glu-tRNA(Gln) amidotransferase A subunit family amidase
MNLTTRLPLSESVHVLRSGKTTVEDFINGICDRIDEADPAVHAFIPEPGRRERLLHDADLLVKKYSGFSEKPPLYGVLVGVKDIFRADGFPTKAGSHLPEKLFEGKESSVVTKLKEAGTLIAGKTVTTEFAFFEPGPTVNPYDQSHTPGGSSSGSAAAVACGFVPLSLGTQTIGSINRPASFCGVYGFKPSYGRIPTDGIIPFSESADHVGFFTQDPEGIEITASVLCEGWNHNLSLPQRKPVIGVTVGRYLQQADDEMRDLLEEKIHQIEKNGIRVVRLNALENIETINVSHRSMVAAEFAKAHENWFREYESLYREKTKELILEGRSVSNEFLENARKGRVSLRNYFDDLAKKNKIDLWLSPSACTAPLSGLGSTGSPLMNLPWTYMGMPTLTVPSGFSNIGLPLGLQFTGTFMEDETLLAWTRLLKNSGL